MIWYLSLTHGASYYLELMDEYLHAKLEDMLARQLVENTALIIMGDHGQRVSQIQTTYRYACSLSVTWSAVG